MFDAVLFDLDETLILDEPVTRHAFRITALELTGDEGQAQRLADAAHHATLELWKTAPAVALEYGARIGHSQFEALWADYDRSLPEEVVFDDAMARLRPEVWRVALAETGIAGDPAKLEARWRALRHRYPLYEDADEVLARLRPHTKLAIVTNGVQGLQRKKLNGCGLLHWFDVVAVSGEVRIGKPERGIFDWVTKQLGVRNERCVMVGDNPDRDVLGGRNAGTKTAWVERSSKPRDVVADVKAKSLKELLPFILNN